MSETTRGTRRDKPAPRSASSPPPRHMVLGPEVQLQRAQTFLERRYGARAVRLELHEPAERFEEERAVQREVERLGLVVLDSFAPARLGGDALKVLAYLRDCTGQWCTMWELRRLLGADTAGFGEPVVSTALRVVEDRGIRIDMAIHYVVYPAPGVTADPYVDTADPLVDPRPLAPADGHVARENVWRIA